MSAPTALRLLGLFALLIAGACGPARYRIHTPTPASVRYAGTTPATEASFHDKRASQQFSSGDIDMEMIYAGGGTEVDFFAKTVSTELNSRGIPVSGGTAPSGLTIEIGSLKMSNRQPGGLFAGFAPLQTITSARIHASYGGVTRSFASFIRRASMVIWSDEEEGVRKKLVDHPQELVAKEIATKIARHLFARQTAPGHVAKLAASIAASTDDKTLSAQVYELGYSNDPAAVPVLLGLVSHEQDLVRVAAIECLGMVGDGSLLPQLAQMAEERIRGVEGLAALKSIGDLGTPEAFGFLEEFGKQHADGSEASRQRQALIRLFL